ncbi:MAG: glycosyltransferase family 4 protein [Verrucomicrobia bacterium]|nr:glycosyltransferase family 4 protein [Verrucomicrobiota bacterium]
MTTDTIGGVWTYAIELCRGLQDHGIEVILATMGRPLLPAQWEQVRGIPTLTIQESSYALEWMDNAWADVDQAGQWLLELEAKFQPDLIHLNAYVHGALLWKAPVLVVGHLCVLSWCRAVKGGEAPMRWNTYRRRAKLGVQAADAVVAPTGWMLFQLERDYGALPRPCVISNSRHVPQGPDLTREPWIITICRLWDEAKNAAVLAAAAAHLTWPVKLVGDARAPDGIVAHWPNVEFLGFQSPDAVIDLCRRASIFALPARYEPFGLAPLEAAQAGCALVLGDIPSLREIWSDAALYVPPNDQTALAAALQSLIADPSRREHYAAAARQRARLYTPEKTTHGYLEVYSELLENREELKTDLPSITSDQQHPATH